MLKLTFASAVIAIGSISSPAFADDESADFFDGLIEDGQSQTDQPRLVSDAELEQQRGGFRFSGLDIKLGADIRTFLNGELALHTTIEWSETAHTQTQIVSGSLTLADADALRNNVLANGAITMNVGGDKVYLANEGQTALVHRGDGALQNVLINTASNITASQEVVGTLDLGGYHHFAEAISADQLGQNLGEDISRSVTGVFGL
jgi:hypothetical protein